VTALVAVHAPQLGSVDPVRVSAWLVDIGETVRTGDRLVELLMPGVTFDVAAPATGRLAAVAAPVNAKVRAGDLLGHISPDDDV
jgi:pyruvate/2-oxoglutarate dehydrogenase complex dihydrolipoamide acyltransferase (E2) component